MIHWPRNGVEGGGGWIVLEHHSLPIHMYLNNVIYMYVIKYNFCYALICLQWIMWHQMLLEENMINLKIRKLCSIFFYRNVNYNKTYKTCIWYCKNIFEVFVQKVYQNEKKKTKKKTVRFCPESVVVHRALVTRSIAEPGKQARLLCSTTWIKLLICHLYLAMK